MYILLISLSVFTISEGMSSSFEGPCYLILRCVINSKIRKILVFTNVFLHILFNSKILHASLRVIPVNQCDLLILVRVFKVFEQNHSYFLEYCDIAFNSKIRKMLVLPTFCAHFVLF